MAQHTCLQLPVPHVQAVSQLGVGVQHGNVTFQGPRYHLWSELTRIALNGFFFTCATLVAGTEMAGKASSGLITCWQSSSLAPQDPGARGGEGSQPPLPSEGLQAEGWRVFFSRLMTRMPPACWASH